METTSFQVKHLTYILLLPMMGKNPRSINANLLSKYADNSACGITSVQLQFSYIDSCVLVVGALWLSAGAQRAEAIYAVKLLVSFYCPFPFNRIKCFNCRGQDRRS
ncbi:hypothetical protein GOODEAATRI_022052 [Goodea atripinnis]|uniref:Uncharacterized protein n=1 Tax=Goodea atripinnis TaxID=208336 RepID=A0ABV0MKW6_9TELE